MSFFSRPGGPFSMDGNGDDGNTAWPSEPATPREPPSRKVKIVRIVTLVLVVLAMVSGSVLNFYTEILWFNAIGFAHIFWGVIGAKASIAAVWFLAAFSIVAVNLWIPKRFKVSFSFAIGAMGSEYRQSLVSRWRSISIAGAAIVGLLAGISAIVDWETWTLWLNRQSFGKLDPHFGLDIGFFVFDLPMSQLVSSNLFSLILIGTIAAGIGHTIFGGIRVQNRHWMITKAANAHLSISAALLILVQIWRFWLMRFELSFSPRGHVTGLSYTDVHAELRAFELLMGIGFICALIFVYTAYRGGWIFPASSVGVLFLSSILLSGVYPEVVQRLQVAPQELSKERQYIERNLEMTRWAFNIDDEYVTYQPFEANSNLTRKQAIDNTSILNSIRVWDPITLRNTYKQLQELRPYYDFSDVDVSRFPIDGEMQQVMLSVREIQTNALNEPTWQNKTTLYTHGYGIVASTVSTAAADGQPNFLSRDIPNRGVPLFDLEQPRIYYGENSPLYSIVGTTGDEFDYETETAQEYTRYDGTGGVNIGSPINRLAYAVKFKELNILLSNLIQSESKIMYDRDVRNRVHKVAPFLQLEKDAYPAVVDGRVKWIQDAYTVTAQVPYAERIDLAKVSKVRERISSSADASTSQVVDVSSLHGVANYVRNSVKAIVDAYDGTVQLVVVDDKDPLINAWRSAFPDSFIDMKDVSEELQNQFRHPEGMFRAQSELLLSYHIQDPDAFYNRSDKWQLPPDRAFAANDAISGAPESVGRTFPPSYQLVRLPGDDKIDFAMIQPFSPAKREVLSAYMAASGNPKSLGKIHIFTMPPTETVFGPSQVFARINQDPEVSQLITLLSDKQSQIIYGNLIVVPVEQSLLYSLPLFLKSQQSEIPELRRVILVYGDQVIMADRLSQALEELFGTIPNLGTGDEPAKGSSSEPSMDHNNGKGIELSAEGRALLSEAILSSIKAQEALAAKDLGKYQKLNADANAALTKLQTRFGVEVKGLEPKAKPEEKPAGKPSENDSGEKAGEGKEGSEEKASDSD